MLLAVVFSGSAQAEDIYSVKSENQTYTAFAEIQIEPGDPNADDCTGADAENFMCLDWSADENAEFMYSKALAAAAQVLTVGFGATGHTV